MKLKRDLVLTPKNVHELIYDKANDFEAEQINSVDHWLARVGMTDEEFTEWIASEFVTSVVNFRSESLTWDNIMVIMADCFMQGMICAAQERLDLEEVEI